MSDREYFVYRVFDSSGVLLYVGCSNNLTRRWAEHRAMRPGFVRRAHRCKAQGPFTRPVARSLEREAAVTEFPLYGWTPFKQSAIQRRNAWLRRRTDELQQSGVRWKEAYDTATSEADRQFGPAITYYAPCPRTRLIGVAA